MKKYLSLLLVILVIISVAFCFAGCGKKADEDQTLTGYYHTEANEHKRGVDLTVTLKGDTIYAVVLASDTDYSVTDPDAFQMMWPAYVTPLVLNLSNMGIDAVMAIEVTVDEQGLPTAISGMPEEWIPDGCTDCAGMVVLALQNALAQTA